jgi:hypothetical protein
VDTEDEEQKKHHAYVGFALPVKPHEEKVPSAVGEKKLR